MRRREGGWWWWGTGLGQTNVLAWARHIGTGPSRPLSLHWPMLCPSLIDFHLFLHPCLLYRAPNYCFPFDLSSGASKFSIYDTKGILAWYSITGTVTKELLALQDCSPEGLPMLPANYLWYLTILMVLFVPPVGLSLCHLLCPAISQVSCSSFPCSTQSAQSQART